MGMLPVPWPSPREAFCVLDLDEVELQALVRVVGSVSPPWPSGAERAVVELIYARARQAGIAVPDRKD